MKLFELFLNYFIYYLEAGTVERSACRLVPRGVFRTVLRTG